MTTLYLCEYDLQTDKKRRVASCRVKEKIKEAGWNVQGKEVEKEGDSRGREGVWGCMAISGVDRIKGWMGSVIQ